VLRYRAYFTERLVGTPVEALRVRRCHLLFYLEDASLQVRRPALAWLLCWHQLLWCCGADQR
jgi:hypothetical protein